MHFLYFYDFATKDLYFICVNKIKIFCVSMYCIILLFKNKLVALQVYLLSLYVVQNYSSFLTAVFFFNNFYCNKISLIMGFFIFYFYCNRISLIMDLYLYFYCTMVSLIMDLYLYFYCSMISLRITCIFFLRVALNLLSFFVLFSFLQFC